MTKYLVKISDPKYRAGLEAKFEKVGTAEASPNYLIVQTVQTIDAIRACEGVMLVEEDESASTEEVDQPDPPGWALTWISNAGGPYKNERTGKDVDIYVIDTGVRDTHNDLAGRVRTLWSFDGQPYSTTGGQSPRHGTAVAACAAGTVYGTAKEATLVNCRIDFMNSTILKALDQIRADHLSKPDDRPSIVNFSGASMSAIIGEMFERLTDVGIVVVAAGGNYAEQKPRYPARSDWVISVGAINQQEQPAYFTNRTCDVFAPGQNVITASVFSDTTTEEMSGTSFSCPYDGGTLACLLEGSDKFNSPKLVSDFMFAALNQMTDKDRVDWPDFDNGHLPVRTITARGFGGVFYVSPSKQYSDEDIKQHLMSIADQPQLVADILKEYNVSLSRVCRIGGLTKDEVNQYFSDAGVTPWWM